MLIVKVDAPCLETVGQLSSIELLVLVVVHYEEHASDAAQRQRPTASEKSLDIADELSAVV